MDNFYYHLAYSFSAIGFGSRSFSIHFYSGVLQESFLNISDVVFQNK